VYGVIDNRNVLQEINATNETSSLQIEAEYNRDVIKKDKYFSILMVDDSPINLRLMELILKPLNCNLVKAESGEEALLKLSQQDFSLILLDIKMPGINGFETARKIKAEKRTEHIPIIFITAHDQELNQIIEGYSSGAVDFIFKPLSHDVLKLKVSAFMKLKNTNNLDLEEIEKPFIYTGEMVNILESITDAFFSIDRNWRFVYLNQTAEKLFDKSRFELKGKLFWDEWSFLTDKAFDQIKKAMDQQIHITFDFDVPNSSLWWEIRVYPTKTGLAIYLNDISKRKQMELELRESTEQFYKVFQVSPNPMAICSVKDLYFVDVNNSWLKNLGYSCEELNGMKNEIVKILESFIIDAKKEKNFPLQRDQKIEYTTKTGEKRIGLLSIEHIEYKDKFCILNVITDITEWENLQNEIKRLDRLNLVGEMAAGLGHEIRNPMQTIRGFLQLLSHNKDFETYDQYFNLMISELDRVNGIISEYLKLAKTKHISRVKQNLNDIIQTILPLMQAEANLSGKFLDLELGVIDQLPLDDKEIRQLLLNIVRNGIEASPNDGVVKIKTFKESSKIILTITDQGPGILENVLEKIGTPFFTTKESGTGLGLAVCYSIANRHNARINIESGPLGTTFSVIFKL
jgi:two-component system, sporulation sensor kinase E